MKSRKILLYILLILILFGSITLLTSAKNTSENINKLDSCSAVWGFYGHKKINRLAVFTLPEGMFSFYKRRIVAGNLENPNLKQLIALLN